MDFGFDLEILPNSVPHVSAIAAAIDELNNQIGYDIYEEAEGDPDKIKYLIRQKAIEKYRIN